MKVGTKNTKTTGVTLTAERVRELAGHIFSEEEIAAAVLGKNFHFTEDDIIKAARFKVRREKEESERRNPPRTDPVMQARISTLFKDLGLRLSQNHGNRSIPVEK